jgi:two-component system chemotaxis response regulator CheB
MTRRKPIRVLVIDDSAVVRQVMAAILSAEGDMEVVTAHEPIIAMRKMKDALPDVILLDLEMPRMDGLTFLRQIRDTHPIPVVICSAFSGAHTEAAVRALEYGAIDMVKKPELGVRGFLDDSAVTLVEMVRAAAASKRRSTSPPPDLDKHSVRLTADALLPKPKPARNPAAARGSERIVAIGTSTGGTVALSQVLGAMPLDCPGIVAVQHMPAGFTTAFAKRLNETCAIEVSEARDGDRVEAGRALIAPGDHHLMVVRRAREYYVSVSDGPAVCRHRPSVDVLFRSVAAAAGQSAVGVLMTGMGDDGAAGLLEMRQAGAKTIAEDPLTCVVYGMPKAAIERGAAERVAPLPRIANEILKIGAVKETA